MKFRPLLLGLLVLTPLLAVATTPGADGNLPRELSSYADPAGADAITVVRARAQAEPFNLVASVIFLLAILHTFATPKIRHWAHAVEKRSARSSFIGSTLHILGEVEAVFGIWALVLVGAICWVKGLDSATYYLGERVSYTEPMFVVVIMALASTRPVMRLAEQSLSLVAALGGGRPVAWWASILTVAPLLGSFITEPAAMTIAALLLAKQFYALHPSLKLRYATLGLLFVNVSIGGTLTHFAAPPVLMVAKAWGWDMKYMLLNFGSHAVTGIMLSNLAYFLAFRKELLALKTKPAAEAAREEPVPAWVTAVHLAFMGFTVWSAHHPVLFVGGFLFYLAFAQATTRHQSKLELRGPLLVGFFLAGLVVHGGLQGWWIQPVLGSLGELPLFFGATILTAFNDNALITYLATLVPGFSEPLKYAVVAGAVTGGGLTVIANAPNPAGQSILQRYFPEGVSPLGLFLGALVPTAIVVFSFMVLG